VFVVLMHSMYGLRSVELDAAERLRAAGYIVVVPDLFEGATTAGDLDAGFALMGAIGWPRIVDRARRSLVDVPAEAVLGGFSMGVGVIGELWPERLNAAAVFGFHAPIRVPEGIPASTPVQLHIAASDGFAPADQVAAFQDSAARAGAHATVHEYRDAGHFFTDLTLPDYNAAAAAAAWTQVLAMLAAHRRG
jgi:dienelactone hydrolase